MRSIWKGHIRFLFVAIPVRIYNAVEASERIQFNQLHREDFGPIGYDKRCKKCGQIVTNEEITKGYQYESDRYAIVFVLIALRDLFVRDEEITKGYQYEYDRVAIGFVLIALRDQNK